MPRTIWIDTSLNQSSTPASTNRLTLLAQPTATESRLAGLTLLRTIIRLDLAPIVMDAGEGSARMDLGIGVASQEAVTLGSTGLPDPADPEAFPPRGWVWRSRYRVWQTAADRAVVVWREIDLDLRARRKLDNGEPYIIFSNTAQEGAAVSVQLVGWIRQLWLLT